jgi:hypothetical protein
MHWRKNVITCGSPTLNGEDKALGDTGYVHWDNFQAPEQIHLTFHFTKEQCLLCQVSWLMMEVDIGKAGSMEYLSIW